MFNLDGKTALITGGGSGLGYAMAKAFVENGAKVVITGRNEEKLQNACAEIGGDIHYIQSDVTELEKVPAFVENLENHFGPIDILVNNAGKQIKKHAHEMTDDEYRQVLDVNLIAVFALTREVGKRMTARKRGSVILIRSMSAIFSLGKVTGYASSKAGILGLMLDLVSEYADTGVRINALAPGFIDTPMFRKAVSNDQPRFNKITGRIPMGRLGKPEDVANAALFFASDASAYVTGTLMPVDGGCAIGF